MPALSLSLLQSPQFFAGVAINYSRALFGTLPHCEEMVFGVADPVTGCAALKLPVASFNLTSAASTASASAPPVEASTSATQTTTTATVHATGALNDCARCQGVSRFHHGVSMSCTFKFVP